jgi:hypothetical protein
VDGRLGRVGIAMVDGAMVVYARSRSFLPVFFLDRFSAFRPALTVPKNKNKNGPFLFLFFGTCVSPDLTVQKIKTKTENSDGIFDPFLGAKNRNAVFWKIKTVSRFLVLDRPTFDSMDQLLNGKAHCMTMADDAEYDG